MRGSERAYVILCSHPFDRAREEKQGSTCLVSITPILKMWCRGLILGADSPRSVCCETFVIHRK